MGLFSIFKRKKPEGKIPIPPSPPGAIPKPAFPEKKPETKPGDNPPMPPSGQPEFPSIPVPKPSAEIKNSEKISLDEPMKAPRQIDDFGIPMKEDFELPDIEMPRFKFPSKDEKAEIKQAIESQKKPKEIPEELPGISEPESFYKPRPSAKTPIPEELPEIGEEPRPSWMDDDVEEPIQLRDIPKSKGPVFMRGDMFMMMKKGISSVKDNLKNMEGAFTNIAEIKNKEEADIDVWHSSIEAIQRKLVYIDKTVFEK